MKLLHPASDTMPRFKSARDVITFHSSVLRLENLKEVPISSNNPFSMLLKETYKLGWPVGGFQDDLDQNAGTFSKFSEGSFL